MTETPICVVPARGGSKRLPGKNLKDLGGMPMMVHSIRCAQATGLFDQVFVATEDPSIAEVARAAGAAVPCLMPEELCGDLVASHAPCQHLAAHLASQGDSRGVLVCLQPTSPLRSTEDLTCALRAFQAERRDFLVSVTPIDPHYFHWAVEAKDQDGWGMYFGTKFLVERPLLPPVFRPNGSIKIARLSRLAEVGHFFGPNLGVVETPEERSIHVATAFDFAMAEFLLERGGAS